MGKIKVKCEVRDGIFDHNRGVTIPTCEKSNTQGWHENDITRNQQNLLLDKSFVGSDYVELFYIEEDKENGLVLVEFRVESDNGHWRAWVDIDNIMEDNGQKFEKVLIKCRRVTIGNAQSVMEINPFDDKLVELTIDESQIVPWSDNGLTTSYCVKSEVITRSKAGGDGRVLVRIQCIDKIWECWINSDRIIEDVGQKSEQKPIRITPTTPLPRSFELRDCSTGTLCGSIIAGVIPFIGSKIRIEKQFGGDIKFRVRDIEYVFLEGSDCVDITVWVTTEN